MKETIKEMTEQLQMCGYDDTSSVLLCRQDQQIAYFYPYVYRRQSVSQSLSRNRHMFHRINDDNNNRSSRSNSGSNDDGNDEEGWLWSAMTLDHLALSIISSCFRRREKAELCSEKVAELRRVEENCRSYEPIKKKTWKCQNLIVSESISSPNLEASEFESFRIWKCQNIKV